MGLFSLVGSVDRLRLALQQPPAHTTMLRSRRRAQVVMLVLMDEMIRLARHAHSLIARFPAGVDCVTGGSLRLEVLAWIRR